MSKLLILAICLYQVLSTTNTFKFYIFQEKCFDKFFTDFNFFDFPCLKLTLSKVLGYMIVLGSTALKIPQIIKILRAKSVQGISFASFALESIINSINIGYNLEKGTPFSIYGENVFILAQNAIIMLLFFCYPIKKDITRYVMWVIFLLTVSVPSLLEIYPSELLAIAMSFSIVLFVLARLAQIMENHKNKSTGNLAFLTNIMNVGGNLARAFTVFTEASNDYLLMAFGIIPFILNGIIFIQFLKYWNNSVYKSVNAEQQKSSHSEKEE